MFSVQFTSSYVKAYDAIHPGSLRVHFYDEARKLFERECGKPSSATAQALMLLFGASTMMAMDRIGYIFRLAACEMYKWLKLGHDLPKKRNAGPEMDVHKKRHARAAWGLFCIEK